MRGIRRTTLVAALGLALLGASALPAVAASAPGEARSVVVRHEAGARRVAEAAVARTGGSVGIRVGLIRAFSAELTPAGIARVRATPGVMSVSENVPLTLSGSGVDGTDPASDLGSMQQVRRLIGADAYWRAGFTGQGVDVALIDSGVVPVRGLRTAGKLVNGPDLSYESQDDDLIHLDTFGHGTHMAGIIGGRDGTRYELRSSDPSRFAGVAPGARIVSVKVADAFGTTDLVQVLAAIDWVVKHRRDPELGLDIRVLNLSFGTNGTQAAAIDPLAYAVERAWRKGIFVVVAAGNEGYGSSKMNSPAYDPFVLAVGASEPRGTRTRTDDRVAPFSSVGDAGRQPDVVAPGTSIVSLRDPGSFLDRTYPGARRGATPRFFRGSGTSQAAAVVSGAAALVIDQRPQITPDELKHLLMSTAYELPEGPARGQGEGLVDLRRALTAPTAAWQQRWLQSTGTGSLERARGTLHVSHDGVELRGATDLWGGTIDLIDWLARSVLDLVWNGGQWLGRSWTGDGWSDSTWAVASWAGIEWEDDSWAGRSWTSDAWEGRSWTGRSWTGGNWRGRSWTSDTWHGDTWSSAGWGP